MANQPSTSSHDAFDLAGQEAARGDAQDKATQRARRDIEDLKWLMANRRGRRFVLSILERAGVWRLSFNPNALQMAFNEGTRNEGLALVKKLTTHCPDLYTQMLKEQNEDE